jgi:hypothetical protein
MATPGLMSEYGNAVTHVTIDGNIFSGQTFTGTHPGGIGFGTQFVEGNNVPRQLVVLGSGGTNGNTPASNITFTNNQITGTAGGISTLDNATAQGNTLVTIDAQSSLIQGNVFSGYTTGSGYALRARALDVDIINNTIDHTVSGSDTKGILVDYFAAPGTYSGNVLNGRSGTDTVWSMTPGADTVSGGEGKRRHRRRCWKRRPQRRRGRRHLRRLRPCVPDRRHR